jgi:RNA polymerase sigma-70 factor (TIGR02960 family)
MPSSRSSVSVIETPAGATTERSETDRRGVVNRYEPERDRRCEDPVLSERALELARSGDEQAFRDLTDPYRRELQVHCYRIVGSLQDSEDLLQETLLAAWRGLDGFDGRASLRAWLYRIATNRSLNALRAGKRRPQSVSAAMDLPEPTRWEDPVWLQPYPDVLLEGLADTSPGPEARYEARESVELAFIAALQQLPPRQRAALVLRDVLGFRTAEIAEVLDTSDASVKGALQRARATLDARGGAPDRERAPLAGSTEERVIVGRFADAVESGDVDTLVELLTDDALLTMPPEPHLYQGRPAIAAFLRNRADRRGAPFHVVATRANTQPAFGCYFAAPHTSIARPYGLLVLTCAGDRIGALTWFSDTGLFPHFGLPRTLRV